MQSISNRPLPVGIDQPEKTLAEYKALQFPYAPGTNTMSVEVVCISSSGVMQPFSVLISLCIFALMSFVFE